MALMGSLPKVSDLLRYPCLCLQTQCLNTVNTQKWWAFSKGRRHFVIITRFFFPFIFFKPGFSSLPASGKALRGWGLEESEGGEWQCNYQMCVGNPLQHLIKACSPLSARNVPPGERGREPFTVSGIICIIQQLFSSDAYHTGLGYKDVRVESPRFRHLCSLFSWEPLRLFLYKCIRLWLSSLWT